jgi:hypothetical protein
MELNNRKRSYMRLAKISIMVLIISMFLGTAAFSQSNGCKDIEKVFKAQDISVNQSDVYESANVCGVCHDQFFQQWSGGLHGKAFKSEVFQILFADAQKTKGYSITTECNKCHQPMAEKSVNASDALLAEGVNCDFCHTITNLDVYQLAGSYVTTPNRIKKAKLENARSPYHPSASSDIVENPRFCASCHEFISREGNNEIIVEDTYTQYMDSSFGRTKRGCVSCHMPTYEGKVANLDVTPSRPKVHNHSFTYPDKEKWIADAVEITIKPYEKKTESINLSLNNKAQGHAFPGGANYFRQAVLTVTGYDDENRQIWSYSTVFGRWYEDKFGNKTYFPWNANKMAYNKLLRADRIESVNFNITEKIKIYNVVATLQYWPMPPDLVSKYNLPVKPIEVDKTSKRPDDY